MKVTLLGISALLFFSVISFSGSLGPIDIAVPVQKFIDDFIVECSSDTEGGLQPSGKSRVTYYSDIRKDVPMFDPAKDFISLHYDFAPDKDDIHSAAADRTVLTSMFGVDEMCRLSLPVSGAYGSTLVTTSTFIEGEAYEIMSAVFKVCDNKNYASTAKQVLSDSEVFRNGFINADKSLLGDRRGKAVRDISNVWARVLKSNEGGSVWVKEGGQGVVTAEVIKELLNRHEIPQSTLKNRLNVVQHSKFNEQHTGDELLAVARNQARYIGLPNANNPNGLCSQDESINKNFTDAINASQFSEFWKTAFKLFNPHDPSLFNVGKKPRVDFSDTTELLYILGRRDGFTSIEKFTELYVNNSVVETNMPSP